MGIEGTRLRGDHRAAGIAAAREWRTAMKPHFDALYGPEGDLRQGVTEGGHRVLDWLNEARPIWADAYDADTCLHVARTFLHLSITNPGAVTELDDLIDVAARVIWAIDQKLAGKGAQA
ncbi:hypothetical protein [Novosphingobium sp.]|uniref:hypothetical protein n=1 Tax=Novosphingobium sp. TaxID=1874826 RepID=UPI0038B8C6DF